MELHISGHSTKFALFFYTLVKISESHQMNLTMKLTVYESPFYTLLLMCY